MASAVLVKDFAQTKVFVWICTNHERVCLDMHRFCSFDNWLGDPISANWQLTLVDNSLNNARDEGYSYKCIIL